MKKEFFKPAITLIIVSVFSFHVSAQEETKYENYHITKTEEGAKKETIKTYTDGHQYKIILVNDKTTELYIDNKKIEKDKIADFVPTINRIRERIKTDETQGEIDRIQGEEDREQGEKDMLQGEEDRMQAEKDRELAKRDEDMMKMMIDDLISGHIIKNKESLSSLALTDTAFFVNGKKQPENIHQQFKKKYDQWTNNGVSYGSMQIKGTSIFFKK